MRIENKFPENASNANNLEIELFRNKYTNKVSYRNELGIIKELESSPLYKSYTVALQQFSANPPVVVQEFENTLEVTVDYQFITNGEYLAIFDKNIFTSPFDYVTISQLPWVDTSTGAFYAVYAAPVFSNVVSISSIWNSVSGDDVIGAFPFNGPCILDIKVYNQ